MRRETQCLSNLPLQLFLKHCAVIYIWLLKVQTGAEICIRWPLPSYYLQQNYRRARAEPDGTRAETTFRLSPKRTSPFKSAGESVQSTAGR